MTAFSPKRGGRYGVRAVCKPCSSQETLARHRTDAGRQAALRAKRAHYARHRVEILAKTADARAAYRRAHPDVVRAGVARRRARIRRAPVCDFTVEEWREVLEEFNHSCAYCLRTDRPLQQEHMQPLIRGGSHTRANIVPACRDCNFRKNRKTALEFLAVGGGTGAWVSD